MKIEIYYGHVFGRMSQRAAIHHSDLWRWNAVGFDEAAA